jgi:hypothetical protein
LMTKSIMYKASSPIFLCMPPTSKQKKHIKATYIF